MGFSTPALRKNGYNPTDDILILDSATYKTDSTSYLEVISGKMIESVAPHSTLRFKADIKTDSVSRTVYMRMKLGGTVVWSESYEGNSYQLRTKDIEIGGYLRETPLSVELKINIAGGFYAYLKNFSICGKQSPFVLD